MSRVSLELGKDTARIVTPADAAAVQGRVRSLLSRPMTADAAAQIALLNNRGLQAQYNGLGVKEDFEIRTVIRAVENELRTRFEIEHPTVAVDWNDGTPCSLLSDVASAPAKKDHDYAGHQCKGYTHASHGHAH